MTAIGDFSVARPDGSLLNLAEQQGKVLLIVNTASKCGFTPQYAGLEALHRRYADRGFAVLGFPCNQFGKQEPGDADEIARFCKLTYDVTFPVMAKSTSTAMGPFRSTTGSRVKHPAYWGRAVSNGTSPNS